MKLGFIGTGTITAAFINGLLRHGSTHEIVVSPRSEEISKALAAKYPSVHRATSNVDVAASSDIVFLAIRPTQVEEALSGIVFAPHQLVISFIAGLGIDELQTLAPQSRVGRLVPLPTIERGEGPVICYPAHAEIAALLEGTGDLVEAADEAQLRSLTGMSAFMSSYFELQLGLIGWLEAEGVGHHAAALYVRSMLAGLARTALDTPDDRLGDLPAEHQTKGGLNQRVRQSLLDAGWFAEPPAAIAQITNAKRSALA